MKKLIKASVGALITIVVLVAKADVSSASSIIYYQPKLPENKL
ncbi:cyclic lactone autoinducer peptide [Evansella sp. AB-rgal1]